MPLPERKYSWSQLLKMITPGDIILIIGIILLGIASLVIIDHLKQPGETATIEVAGKMPQQVNLQETQVLSLRGAIGQTTIRIDHGAVQVTHSDCPEKICVRTGKIRQAGEMIVCVPNKIVIRINGRHNQTFDVITQ